MLNIVFSSDDNYVPHLSIAITSLIKNNKKDFKKINIFILDDGISLKNKEKLEKITNNLTFIKTKNLNDLNAHIVGLSRNKTLNSFTTYSRLFISSLLPKDIDKVIYLDCDGLILDSFKELWDINIDNYYCGAVLDGINTAIKNRLGFKLEEDYINAGVLLINLKKWRESNIEEKFISFMVENQNRFYQHDQGILNNVLKDQFLILNPKYNLQIYFQTLDYDLAKKFTAMKGEYYSKDIIQQAMKNPTFLHFCGPNYNRPWYNKNHPYRKLYEEYSKLAGFESVIEDMEFSSKINIFYRFMKIPFLLKLVPKKFIYKSISKNALKGFNDEELKVKESLSEL